MKNSLLVWLVVQSLLVAAVALFLAVDGRHRLRAETQRTQALEGRLGNSESRLAQAETDLAKARSEFADELGRVRAIQARHREALRRLLGEEFLADFSHCHWREGASQDFDFAPVTVRNGKTTTAVSSNGTRYSLTLSTDTATLTLTQENRGSARRSTYVRSGTEGRLYVGTYTFNGIAPAGAEGYVLLQPTGDDPLALPPAPTPDAPR
jgi:hypothetical protein